MSLNYLFKAGVTADDDDDDFGKSAIITSPWYSCLINLTL